MNLDRLLISSITNSNKENILEVLRKVLTVGHIFTTDNKKVFEKVVKHVEKYAEPPSLEYLEHEFPKFDFDPPADPLDFILEKAIETKEFKQIQETLVAIEQALTQRTPRDAMNELIMRAKVVERIDIVSTDIDVKEDFDSWKEEYIKRKESGDTKGLPTGIELLDNTLNGIHPGEFWIIAARPQSFKTWLLCELFRVAGSVCDETCSVLFFSKEMTKQQIYDRVLAMIGNINYSALRKSELTEDDFKAIKDNLTEDLNARLKIIGKGQFDQLNEAYIKAKIIEYNPSAAYVDGLYLFGEGEGWDEQTSMTRNMRAIALDTGVPIIGTVQFNKKGMGINNIAYSDSYGQDASVIIGIERERDESQDKATKTIRMKILKAREGETDGETYLSLGIKKCGFVAGRSDPDGDDFIHDAIEGIKV